MPFEKGGLADKLGNRYESRWLATWLLKLLNEKIQSVTIEPIGDDEQGVDIWIVENGGVRQAHQCKANNSSKESWEVSDLEARGVLAKMQFQLDRDESNQFFFVSSVGSNKMKSICEYARRSHGNPDLFFEEKIENSSIDVRECYEKFCKYLSLDSQNQQDRSRAFNYLRRINITVFPDDKGAWQNLLDSADSLLAGDSEVAISTLLSYVTNNDLFGKPIYADELRGYLAEKGFHPKRLSHDSRIAPVIETLQREFAESIQPLLIGGLPIQRLVTSKLISAIHDQKNILVIGSAGTGKSGVLYELTEKLKATGIPYLPVRLDRRVPKDNPAQFGHNLGLPDCPVYSLAALAGLRQSVLIFDQLDAIRWTSSHADTALEICKQLLRHNVLLRKEGQKISMVLCCRKFDLEHDAAIKNWLNGPDSQDFEKIEVGSLTDEEVKRFVTKSYAQMSSKEQNLLAIPLNLSIWLELSRSGPVPAFRSATDLMREFWRNRRTILEHLASISADQLDLFLTPLLDFMEKNGSISAPGRVIAKWPTVANALYSYGILQLSAGQVTFCHQRYLAGC